MATRSSKTTINPVTGMTETEYNALNRELCLSLSYYLTLVGKLSKVARTLEQKERDAEGDMYQEEERLKAALDVKYGGWGFDRKLRSDIALALKF